MLMPRFASLCAGESRLNLNLSLIFLLKANVRGQGTRHLVEGTLDPLVGHFHVLPPAYGWANVVIRNTPKSIVIRVVGASSLEMRMLRAGCFNK